MCAPFNRRNTVSNWERGAKESDGLEAASSASASANAVAAGTNKKKKVQKEN